MSCLLILGNGPTFLAFMCAIVCHRTWDRWNLLLSNARRDTQWPDVPGGLRRGRAAETSPVSLVEGALGEKILGCGPPGTRRLCDVSVTMEISLHGEGAGFHRPAWALREEQMLLLPLSEARPLPSGSPCWSAVVGSPGAAQSPGSLWVMTS